MCSGKTYMMPFFLQVAIAWAQQAELVLKNIFFDKILTGHSHTTSND